MAEEQEAVPGRPWLRAWLVVGLAAWAQIGVLLVNWANNRGLVEDVSFSPYHLVGYAALLVLAVYVVWAFFRGLRRSDWRRAFPPMYGGLGVAFVLLVGWVVLDIAWRSTLGINFGIESGLAPPRLLIPAALVLLAVGPLREAIADRAHPGLSPGELSVRWAGVVAAGLIGGALTLSAFNPVGGPLNDYAVNPGVDATEIWVMSADGERQTRLLPALGDGTDYSLPAWSPDGTRIAYTTWTNLEGVRQSIKNEDQTAEIWTMAADGSDRRLVFDNGLISTSVPSHAWIPAWSPDGQWIAFTLSPVGVQPSSDNGPQANAAPGQIGPPTAAAGASIWVVHPDGSGSVRLTPEGMDAVGGTWSPDGTHLAYVVAAGADSSDIHVANINVGAPGVLPEGGPTLRDDREIAVDDATDWGPAWAPDGRRVAFTSDRSGNDDIWVAALDGSAPTQLTDNPAGDWVPAYSPLGTWIAFTSDRSGEAEVWLMSPDGTGPANLTDHPLHYDGQWSTSWSPDGNQLAYATGSFQDAANSGWVREDLAAAQALLFGIALAIVALLVVALGAPLGSFTLALTIIVAMSAFPAEQWRFLPAAVIAGLITDGLVRSVRLRHRARVAAAALPALANLAIGLTIGAGGTLAWSITLLLGVTLFSALLGWALAEAVERLLRRPAAPAEATAG